ncbi:MAG TPA: hypothetical protein PLX23_10770 [Candidatus Hydrogenedens sp.]|nr:hypothetical protein [Candidatus Hydrogenedens sp.]
MKHIKHATQFRIIPQQADSTLQKQQQVEVWNSSIEMLGSLFDLLVKISDKIKGTDSESS